MTLWRENFKRAPLILNKCDEQVNCITIYKIYLRPGLICHYVVFFVKKGTSLNAISNSTPIIQSSC